MQIGRVIGTLISTQKNRKYEGAKLLLVQFEAPDGTARGNPVLAIDAVGAGVHERVLVVQEGRAAGEALGRKAAPVDTAIIGIIDQVDEIAGGTDPVEPQGNAPTRPAKRRHNGAHSAPARERRGA